jgi:hypothetical protein
MYQLMESQPDVEFDYILAEKLGMTVADLRRRMSQAEWLGWYVYLGRKAQRREMESVMAKAGR